MTCKSDRQSPSTLSERCENPNDNTWGWSGGKEQSQRLLQEKMGSTHLCLREQNTVIMLVLVSRFSLPLLKIYMKHSCMSLSPSPPPHQSLLPSTSLSQHITAYLCTSTRYLYLSCMEKSACSVLRAKTVAWEFLKLSSTDSKKNIFFLIGNPSLIRVSGCAMRLLVNGFQRKISLLETQLQFHTCRYWSCASQLFYSAPWW